jgi:hypothetical protein
MKLKRILLALTMVFTFTACNVRPAEATEALTETETTTAEETTAPTETTTTAPPETTTETVTETEAPPEIKTVFSDDGKLLNVYSISDEFPNFINDFYLSHNSLPAGVRANFIITPGNSYEYTQKLEADILANISADSSKKVDLFIGEYLFSVVLSDPKYSVPLTELGITESELSDQFPYTKTVTSSVSGEQMGVAYQNTAELVIYRKSIARAVLGSDDPEKVAASLSSFEKFDETAKKMKTYGYTMLGSPYETFQMYVSSQKSPLVARGTNKITIPEAWTQWAESAKEYTDNGYALKTMIWHDEWKTGIKTGSRIFAYIGPQWYSEWSVGAETNDKNDWDYCPGPVASYWGGSTIFAANGTDNASLTADIMRYFGTDKDGMRLFTEETGHPANSISVSNEIGDMSMWSQLGSTGYFPLTRFSDAAEKISVDYNSLSNYDLLCEDFQGSMWGYINGEVTYEQALDDFYIRAIGLFPELTR